MLKKISQIEEAQLKCNFRLLAKNSSPKILRSWRLSKDFTSTVTFLRFSPMAKEKEKEEVN